MWSTPAIYPIQQQAFTSGPLFAGPRTKALLPAKEKGDEGGAEQRVESSSVC
jgi:hypothetical protein